MIDFRAIARAAVLTLTCTMSLTLAGCGGGSGSNSSGSASYTVGGTVTGMNGTGLVLQLNGANDLTLNANGTFAFSAQADASSYTVTVKAQPTTANNQTCTIANGSGTLAGANVASVAVTCSPWTKQFGSIETVTYGATADAGGNVYMTGYTQGGVNDSTQQSAYVDLFVTKYDAYGNLVFNQQLGMPGANVVTDGYAVAADSNGNVYVTGYAEGGLDGHALIGGSDCFLTKYDGLGNKLYTRMQGTSDGGASAQCHAIAVDANDNVYVAGFTTGSIDGQPLTGFEDAFFTKYDAAGNKLYTRELGVATSYTHIDGITVDANGNIYVTGYTRGALDGITVHSASDVFLTKYDASGTKLYTRQTGGDYCRTYGYSVTTDASGNVYVAGETNGSLNGVPITGWTDAFLIKFDASGNTLSTKLIGDASGDSSAHSVAVDAQGNVYLAGSTMGNLDGNTLIGAQDIFLIKYDPAGTRLYTKQSGATGVTAEGKAIGIDASGHLYIGGSVDGDFDGNTFSGGSTDAVLLKYDLAGVEQ